MGLSVKLCKRLLGFTLDIEWNIGNELAVLFGHSGSGKSLTLQLIAGLMRPDRGFIRANGDFFYDENSKINLPPQRRCLGYVFQDRILFPHMTVEENIAYGLPGTGRPKRQTKVREMINVFHLGGLEKKFPFQISGGQKQRVAFATALIRKPKALLLDEPFSALDNSIRFEMRNLLRDIRTEFDIPVILVTHDVFEAYTLADRVIVYSKGRIVQTGHPEEILHPPRSSGSQASWEAAPT